MNNLEIIIHKWIINRYMKKKLVLPSLRFKLPAGGGLLPGRHLEMCVWRNFWIVTVTGDSPRHLDTKKKKKKTLYAYKTVWLNEELSHHNVNSTDGVPVLNRYDLWGDIRKLEWIIYFLSLFLLQCSLRPIK